MRNRWWWTRAQSQQIIPQFSITLSSVNYRLTKLEFLCSQLNAKVEHFLDLLSEDRISSNNNVNNMDVLTSFPFPRTDVSHIIAFEEKLNGGGFRNDFVRTSEILNSQFTYIQLIPIIYYRYKNFRKWMEFPEI